MTWKEFKAEVEKLGITDDYEVKWVYNGAPYIHPPHLEVDDIKSILYICDAYDVRN